MFFLLCARALYFAVQRGTRDAEATAQTGNRGPLFSEMPMFFLVFDVVLWLTPLFASAAPVCLPSSNTQALPFPWHAFLPTFPLLPRRAGGQVFPERSTAPFSTDVASTPWQGTQLPSVDPRFLSARQTRCTGAASCCRCRAERAASVVWQCGSPSKTSCKDPVTRYRLSRSPAFLGPSNAVASFFPLQPCCLKSTSYVPVTVPAVFSHTHSRCRKRWEELPGNPTGLFSSLPVDLGNEFPFRHSTRTARTAELETLIYFDNAATTQKPRRVLRALEEAYVLENANVHRATYSRAAAATERMEAVRAHLARFIRAERPEEIIFTGGATDAINLVANSWGEIHVSEGDDIILSVAEHHSNLVPWQLLAKRKKANLKFVELNKDYTVSLPSLGSLLSQKTKLVALSHTSNVLGSFNPHLRLGVAMVKRHNTNTTVLLDATQALAHSPIDVQELGCDFLVGSAHKMYGPTGVGFLFGRYQLLRDMPPWKAGGEMIETVDYDTSTYADPPARFEAGTPPFLQIAGLGAALSFIEEIGWPAIQAHEQQLGAALRSVLSGMQPELHLFSAASPVTSHEAPSLTELPCNSFRPLLRTDVRKGAKQHGAVREDKLSALEDDAGRLVRRWSWESAYPTLPPIPLVAFAHPRVHAHDLAMFLDVYGSVCVRSGHHCCQPLHRHVLAVPATCRASLALYNTVDEVHRFGDVLSHVVRKLDKEHGDSPPRPVPESG